MRVRIAGTLDDNQKKAIPRAKMYHGPDKYEYFAGCVIWYKKGVATIIPQQYLWVCESDAVWRAYSGGYLIDSCAKYLLMLRQSLTISLYSQATQTRNDFDVSAYFAENDNPHTIEIFDSGDVFVTVLDIRERNTPYGTVFYETSIPSQLHFRVQEYTPSDPPNAPTQYSLQHIGRTDMIGAASLAEFSREDNSATSAIVLFGGMAYLVGRTLGPIESGWLVELSLYARSTTGAWRLVVAFNTQALETGDMYRIARGAPNEGATGVYASGVSICSVLPSSHPDHFFARSLHYVEENYELRLLYDDSFYTDFDYYQSDWNAPPLASVQNTNGSTLMVEHRWSVERYNEYGVWFFDDMREVHVWYRGASGVWLRGITFDTNYMRLTDFVSYVQWLTGPGDVVRWWGSVEVEGVAHYRIDTWAMIDGTFRQLQAIDLGLSAPAANEYFCFSQDQTETLGVYTAGEQIINLGIVILPSWTAEHPYPVCLSRPLNVVAQGNDRTWRTVPFSSQVVTDIPYNEAPEILAHSMLVHGDMVAISYTKYDHGDATYPSSETLVDFNVHTCRCCALFALNAAKEYVFVREVTSDLYVYHAYPGWPHATYPPFYDVSVQLANTHAVLGFETAAGVTYELWEKQNGAWAMARSDFIANGHAYTFVENGRIYQQGIISDNIYAPSGANYAVDEANFPAWVYSNLLANSQGEHPWVLVSPTLFSGLYSSISVQSGQTIRIAEQRPPTNNSASANSIDRFISTKVTLFSGATGAWAQKGEPVTRYSANAGLEAAVSPVRTRIGKLGYLYNLQSTAPTPPFYTYWLEKKDADGNPTGLLDVAHPRRTVWISGIERTNVQQPAQAAHFGSGEYWAGFGIVGAYGRIRPPGAA